MREVAAPNVVTEKISNNSTFNSKKIYSEKYCRLGRGKVMVTEPQGRNYLGRVCGDFPIGNSDVT